MVWPVLCELLALSDTCILGLSDDVERLKEFDRSTVVSRKGSRAPTPPTSVKGIGGKGA